MVTSLISLAIGSQLVGPTTQLRNLNFKELGPTNPTLFEGTFPGAWAPSSVAGFDQFVSIGGAKVFTQVLPSTHPQGGRMLRCVTDFGYNPAVMYGSGFSQSGYMKSGTKFEYDLFVVSASVTGGPVRANGTFMDSTAYTPNGAWRHVTISLSEPGVGIAWEWLGSNGTAEFYVANIRYLPSVGIR